MRLVLVTTVLVLASLSPAWASSPGPCKVVTGADARKALGTSAGAGRAEAIGQYKGCLYIAGSRILTVLERPLSRGSFDISAKKNPGPTAHVGGIGSDAYSVRGGEGLLVWKNGTEIVLSVQGGGATLKTDETLGKAAANRL